MKFSASIITALFAAGAIAAPKGRGLKNRLGRRAAGLQRQSQPMIKSDGPAQQGLEASNATNVEYSSNWAGAALTSPPTGETFTAAYGTFTVPTPSSRGSASAWVGIDGYNTDDIIQSGIDFTYSGGSVSYDAWYEWYPDYAYDFSNFDISAGDVIKISIVTSSTSAGTVTLENETTGTSVSESLTAYDGYDLEEQNAEWIVEDYEEDGSLVTFADFGSVTFTDAYAVTSSGTEVGLTDATVIDIEQNSVLTSVTINSDSEVTIKYV